MLAPSAIELKFFKKKIFLAASKISRLYDNVLFAASSENEKSQIEKYFPHNEIKIAPNLSRIQSEKIAHPEKKAGELKLLNIARIALEKNLQYALEILKNVKEKVQFDFYGSVYDENYWKKCKEEIQQLPKNISAEYKGAVNSEKIFEIMRDYHFLFLPTRGENFGHIILESMSAGLPVIISDKTPWKNLSEKKAGWDIPLSDPEKFADIIEQCAKMNSDEYKIFSEGAFKQASSYINNQKKIQANRELFS